MTLRPTELDDVAREIARTLVGRAVQKVVQPDDATVVLAFARVHLWLSADARRGRLHLGDKPPATGEAAPAFCMLLRKELTGERLLRVDAVAGERAVELVFSPDTKSLRLYLFGPGAQLQLVADGRVAASIGPRRAPIAGLPPPRAAAESRRFPADNPSAAIAAHYAEAADKDAADRARAARRAAQKKLERLIVGLAADRERARSAADKRKWGDLLLAHAHEISRGAPSVTLPDDFTDGTPLSIALDPSLSARQNAERYYKEHKRMSRALAGIEARLADARARVAELEGPAAELGDFGARSPVKAPGRARGKPLRRPPYREFRSASGAVILVGRGADRNDELTFKVARGNDLWLHARDVPGAHVVVPLSGRPVDGETLLDAATLAAHHSDARDEAQVDVLYLLRKLVKKPRRAPPGQVTHAGGKTLRVRMEKARLARLLASRVEEER